MWLLNHKSRSNRSDAVLSVIDPIFIKPQKNKHIDELN